MKDDVNDSDGPIPPEETGELNGFFICPAGTVLCPNTYIFANSGCCTPCKEICHNGRCQIIGCSPNCSGEEICVEHVCQPPSCESHSDCHANYGCYKGCVSNADCVDGKCTSGTELCETGRCLPIVNISNPCTEDTDCPGGYYCSSKYCIPSKVVGTCDADNQATCEPPHKCVTTGSVKGCCHASATEVQLVGDPNSPSIVCCETKPCHHGFCCDKDHPCTKGQCLRSPSEDVQCSTGKIYNEGQCIANCENQTMYCASPSECISDTCCAPEHICIGPFSYEFSKSCCASDQMCIEGFCVPK